MLTANHIFHSFDGRSVLRDITVDFPERSLSGLIGPSGGGKSTLLKILGGVLTPDSGEVLRPDSSQISLMFQEGALFDSLTVFDNIAFPLVGGRVPAMILGEAERGKVHHEVEGILARVGLTKASEKVPAQLSGGMRRRVSLARALVTKPQVLLLDDPTAGLDPVASSVIMELIVELHKEYRPTTVVVSHDLRRLLPMVERTVALFDGGISFAGTTEELRVGAPAEVRNFVQCRFDFASEGVASPTP